MGFQPTRSTLKSLRAPRMLRVMGKTERISRREALAWSASSLAALSCTQTQPCRAPAPLPPPGGGARGPLSVDATGPLAPGTQMALTPEVTQTLRIERTHGAPDGFERSMFTVNGQYPGPVVRVKKGEKVAIAINNGTLRPATNHWHGQYQVQTWRMDGVPGVTQPSIPKGKTFTARFTPDPGGTFWYHSHELLYNAYPDGQYGAMIVADPDIDDLYHYDQEAVLVCNDWFHRTADEILFSLLNPPKGGNSDYPGGGDVKWVSGLINGKGRYEGGPKVPLEVVEVEPGSVTRFRVINASSTYELFFSVDNHDFTVFCADSLPIKAIKGDKIRIPIGARYDLLVKANGSGVNWIRVGNAAGQEALGILRYKGAAATEPPPSKAKAPQRLIVRDMLESREPMVVRNTDLTLFDFNLKGSMTPYVWDMNGERYPVATMMSVKKGDQVRIILRNKTMMQHPYHLHGHGFWILGDPKNLNLKNRPKVDTVLVEPFKDVAIQFKADNPGKWFFHCHIDWHLATGMARVLHYESINTLQSNTFPPGSLSG